MSVEANGTPIADLAAAIAVGAEPGAGRAATGAAHGAAVPGGA